MNTDDEGAQILLNLGLSYSQVRMWLTICRLGEANITEIAKHAKIDRAEGSRTIQKLQKLGLIDEIIDVPRRFKAMPVKEGVSVLLHRRELEYQNLVNRAKFFTKHDADELKESIDNNARIVALNGHDRVFEYVKRASGGVEESSDLCGDWQGFRHMIYENVENLNKMRKKGVRFRIIIERPHNDHISSEFTKFASKNLNVEIRVFEQSEVPLFVWIFDKKEIVFAIRPASDFRLPKESQAPVIASNAPALIHMGQTYFDQIWVNARPLKIDDT
ncbi:MAG: helix-turn-helix domain-containing protein [Candidatus Bathyarchaeia archaeon]|jgi:sugar-specific transcriptional regulator TrmB